MSRTQLLLPTAPTGYGVRCDSYEESHLYDSPQTTGAVNTVIKEHLKSGRGEITASPRGQLCLLWWCDCPDAYYYLSGVLLQHGCRRWDPTMMQLKSTTSMYNLCFAFFHLRQQTLRNARSLELSSQIFYTATLSLSHPVLCTYWVILSCISCSRGTASMG